MNILDALKRDHDRVREALDGMAAESDAAALDAQVESLLRAVMAHAHAEEDTLYAMLEGFDETEALAEQGADEHLAVIERLAGLARRAAPTPSWRSDLAALRADLLRHVAEEEGRLFARAKALLQEAELHRLGRAFEMERARLLEGDGAADTRRTA